MLDRADLTTPMPDLVALAEHAIFYGLEGMEPLRCLDMETLDTITLTNGIGALPATYLQWRRVCEIVVPRRELEYIAPAGADQEYATRSAGLGNHFTIIGTNLYTFPLVQNTVELTHYAKPTALDSANPTAAAPLLAKYPGVYLRATCAMAAEWIKDDGESQKQLALLKAMIGGLNRMAQMTAMAKTGITFRRAVR